MNDQSPLALVADQCFVPPAWRRILAQLDAVCMEYVESYCRPGVAIDVPWFYNERASLSQLAGAIWRANPSNLVLEEYACEKGQEGGSQRYKGRRDLWFRAEGVQYWGEAKQHWGSLDSFPKDLEEACRIARQEHDVIERLDGRVNVGLCFVSWKQPWVEMRQIPTENGTQIHGETLIHHLFPDHLHTGDLRSEWAGMSLVMIFSPSL